MTAPRRWRSDLPRPANPPARRRRLRRPAKRRRLQRPRHVATKRPFVPSGKRSAAPVSGNRLFRNDAGATFVDVTDAAGVGDPLFGASAAFFDFDRDGQLDLFITNYVDFSTSNNRARSASFSVQMIYIMKPNRAATIPVDPAFAASRM